jgi:hypothetical protein
VSKITFGPDEVPATYTLPGGNPSTRPGLSLCPTSGAGLHLDPRCISGLWSSQGDPLSAIVVRRGQGGRRQQKKAEGEGFEPPVRFPVQRLSSSVASSEPL